MMQLAQQTDCGSEFHAYVNEKVCSPILVLTISELLGDCRLDQTSAAVWTRAGHC